MRHVGGALGDSLEQARNNIVTIGVVPWGVVHNRRDLLGREVSAEGLFVPKIYRFKSRKARIDIFWYVAIKG